MTQSLGARFRKPVNFHEPGEQYATNRELTPNTHAQQEHNNSLQKLFVRWPNPPFQRSYIHLSEHNKLTFSGNELNNAFVFQEWPVGLPISSGHLQRVPRVCWEGPGRQFRGLSIHVRKSFGADLSIGTVWCRFHTTPTTKQCGAVSGCIDLVFEGLIEQRVVQEHVYADPMFTSWPAGTCTTAWVCMHSWGRQKESEPQCRKSCIGSPLCLLACGHWNSLTCMASSTRVLKDFPSIDFGLGEGTAAFWTYSKPNRFSSLLPCLWLRNFLLGQVFPLPLGPLWSNSTRSQQYILLAQLLNRLLYCCNSPTPGTVWCHNLNDSLGAQVFPRYLWASVITGVVIHKYSVQKLDVARISWRQNGLLILKLNVLGGSFALNFNVPPKMESYTNEKSNTLSLIYKQMNQTLFQIYLFWTIS